MEPPGNRGHRTGSATVVAFWNGASSLSYDAGPYWDNGDKRLGLGTTTPAYALDVNGYTASTGFVQTSDRRLKNDIARITSGLAIIDQRKPVSFRWKNDGRAAAGLIAQDVLGVIPTAVASNTEGTYAVAYNQTIPYLIKGMQELKTSLDDLIAANENLKQQLEAANDNHQKDEAAIQNLTREVKGLKARGR